MTQDQNTQKVASEDCEWLPMWQGNSHTCSPLTLLDAFVNVRLHIMIYIR